MKKLSIFLMLLMGVFLPWAANGQNTITLTGNVTQTIAPNTTYDFYDSGGPNSNYGNSQNYTATLTCVGDITINFTEFETENSSDCYDWDHMHIYDGTASNGTLLARGQSGCTSATLTTGVNYVATSGTMTIVWKSDSSTNKAGWAATITGGAAPACPKPMNFTCTASTGTPATATFTWTNGGTETDWVLEYGTASDFTGASSKSISQSDLVNGKYTLTTGLTAETKYYAHIKADCGGGEVSDWSNTIEFKPSNVQTVAIGSGESTNSYLPAYTYNNNTLSEQIYTAAEIGMAGTINSIAFYNAGSTKNPNFKVYLVHTDKTAFSSATDWLTVTAGDLVFEGDVTLTAGQWTTIEFDTGFEYDGCSNLGLVVDENMSYSSGLACRVFSSTDNCSMYVTSDGTNYNAVGATYSGTRLSVKNQLQLGILPNLKPKPNNLVLVDGSLSPTGATLEWQAPCTASPTGYEYQYKPATDQWPATWTSNSTNLSTPLSGLTSSTTYDFRVRANYAAGDSDPVEIQFTTEASCLPVTDIIVSDITSEGAKLAWTPSGTEYNWQYLTVAHGDTPDWTSDRILVSNTHTNVPANIAFCTGQPAQPNTEYDFYVRAHCGGGDYSEAVMLTFRTACGTITSFPWSENFNGYSNTVTSTTAPTSYPNDVKPDCWTFLNRSETTGSYPQAFLTSSSTYAVSGNCLFFKSSSSTPLYAVLPEFSNRIAELKLTFTYRNEGTGTSNGTLYVGYMTDPNDANTFNEQDQIACSQTTTKTTLTVRFANAPAGSHFAFKYQGGTSNNYYLSIDDVIVEERVLVIANQVVYEGNVVNDYQMTWNQFAEHVNNGHEFIDAISLMEDITINTMVGTEAHPFMGTFNGQGYTITMADGAFGNSTTYTSTERCAPFQRTQGATIRNLNTTGSIYTSAKCAAGLIGYTEGNCTITNCSSDVIITSTVSGDGTHAGLIAVTKGGTAYSSTIEGCAFSGKLLGESTGGSAGLVGYNNQVLTITNCVVAPSEITMTCAGQSSATFVRNGGTLNINNSYYNNITFGGSPTLQGKEMFSIIGVSPVTMASSESSYDYYSVSDISAYTTGVMYKGTFYAGDGETVNLALDGARGYEANHGTLEASGANYTLLMEAFDTEISGINCPAPFNVAVSDITNNSATITWQGNDDAYIVRYRPVVSTEVTDFTEEFSNQTAAGVSGSGQLPEGWMSYNNIEGAYLPRVSNGSKYGFLSSAYPSNDNFLLLSLNSEGDDTQYIYAIMPKYNGIESVAFNYAFESNSIGTLTFGYVTDNTGYATYQALQTLTAAESKTVYDYSLTAADIATINSNNGYITFCYSGQLEGGYYSVGIDDIAIRSLAESQWTTVEDVEGLNQGLTGLASNTEYEVQVQADCGSTDGTSAWVGTTFTTLDDCALPYELNATNLTATSATLSWTGVQDSYNVRYREVITAPVEFDETYDFEDGWYGWTTESNDNDENAWTIESGASNAHGGTHFARSRYTSSSVGGDANDWLISPQIPLGGTLSFYAKKYTSGTDRFQVYVSTTENNISDFTAISEVITPNTTYDLYEYDLSSYSGNGYIAIVYTAPNDQYYVYVDDIHITASIAGEYGSWNTDNTNVTSGLPVNGLTPNTTYEWQVQGIDCDGEGTPTDWSETASFATLLPTFTKTIAAVGNENWAEGKGGYYLIASPLAEEVDPTTIIGMTTGDYDLYSFDQDPTDASGLEWRNYRASAFNLVNGQGYLYANKEGVTLTFVGVPGTNGSVTLSKTDDESVDFQGWNLVGNPFGVDAYITKPFYTLENSDTYTENTAGTAIHAMQGLFVVADNDEETLTFSTVAPSKKVAKLNMNVSKGNSVVDHAILSFSEGQQLPKLQFRKGSTKVYMPKEGKDYAVVSAEESMGEMPVNFKAESNGTYTISFTSEEVSFAYLHLIDNMTGEDVYLLAGASTGSATYTFDARTTDYESRFKLVFATGNNANDDAFAFYSNGSFVINNEGNATLQVIDVNGRILKNESINGCANVNINAAQGIYMLRLVNGDNVKVQKVMVR